MSSISIGSQFYRLIGILHGITNSGGTLMSLILSNSQEKFMQDIASHFFIYC